jgi:multiple sugar transport system permease protein
VVMKKTGKKGWGPLPWIAPALIMIITFVLWPAFEMARTSFQIISISGLVRGWAGLSNYTTLLQNPDLPGVLIRTALWVGLVGLFTVLISIPLSLLLNANFPGRRFVRFSVIVPWAASLVMTATSWRWILNGFYGIMNTIAMSLHLISAPIDWLGDPKIAFLWLIGVAVFVSIPFTTYVLLAGLQSIPHEVLEAAKVDGAGGFRAYRSVTFPLLRPALLVSAIINLINVFNSFPIIWVMTAGGPGYETDTSTTLAYKIAFRDQDVGQSASMAVFNFIFILIFILFFLKISKWRETDQS